MTDVRRAGRAFLAREGHRVNRDRLYPGSDEDAHALAEVLLFLQHVPDRERADRVSGQAGGWLVEAPWFRADPTDPRYGMTPLHLAPTPDSP